MEAKRYGAVGLFVILWAVSFGFAWYGLKHAGWISPVCGVLALVFWILGWVALATGGDSKGRKRGAEP